MARQKTTKQKPPSSNKEKAALVNAFSSNIWAKEAARRAARRGEKKEKQKKLEEGALAAKRKLNELKEKAKRLASAGETVLFIVCHGGWDPPGRDSKKESTSESFLCTRTKQELSKFKNVTVEYVHVSEVVARMTAALESDTHVLADEFRDPSNENREGCKRLREVAKKKV